MGIFYCIGVGVGVGVSVIDEFGGNNGGFAIGWSGKIFSIEFFFDSICFNMNRRFLLVLLLLVACAV